MKRIKIKILILSIVVALILSIQTPIVQFVPEDTILNLNMFFLIPFILIGFFFAIPGMIFNQIIMLFVDFGDIFKTVIITATNLFFWSWFLYFTFSKFLLKPKE